MSEHAGDLQAKRAWIERVLSFQFPDAAAAPDVETIAEPAEDPAERAALVASVKDLAIQSSLLPEPFRADMIARARQTAAAVKGMDLDSLAAEVEYLSSAYAAAAGEARAEEARKVSKGSVKYRKLQLKWREAQTSASTELDRFIAAILADPDIQEDELFEDVVEATSAASTLVPRFGGELSGLLDQLDATTEASVRDALHKEAHKLIDEYVTLLDEAEGLKELQKLADDEYGGISFVGELQTALKSLASALP